MTKRKFLSVLACIALAPKLAKMGEVITTHLNSERWRVDISYTLRGKWIHDTQFIDGYENGFGHYPPIPQESSEFQVRHLWLGENSEERPFVGSVYKV